ncbi:MAG: hypothetical protein M0P12_01090 [Paludibacteraceae bacterium]|nr:hypothetical protein [Paludibacteraceae bacterium]
MEWIAAIIGSVATIIVAFYKYRSEKNSDVKKQLEAQNIKDCEASIKDIEIKITTAMESSITDVPNLRIKLNELRKNLKKLQKKAGLVVVIALTVFLMQGCKTQTYVVIGERILKPNPGDVLTIPELKKPAKQWYLIDDVAMLGVLGVNKLVAEENSSKEVKE